MARGKTTKEAAPPTVTRANVLTLPDGRIEASVVDDPENPVDEHIVRTCPETAVAAIFDSVTPGLRRHLDGVKGKGE